MSDPPIDNVDPRTEHEESLLAALDALSVDHPGDPPPSGEYWARVAEEALSLIRHYQAWVRDLQSGMFINCVYCGHCYGPKDVVPATMADALKEHIEHCLAHPMSALRIQRDDLARALFKIRSLTMRGKGNKQVADIACDAVLSIDETPLFEVAGAEPAAEPE